MIAQARLSRVAGLALPIIAGAMATNLMSVIDTLMVGQLGVASLGGVGIGSQLFFLLVAVALGLAAGVQASVARRVGEGHVHRAGFYLNAGLLIAILAGFVLVLAGFAAFKPLFALLHDDPLLVAEGWDYLALRLPSVLIIAINVAFRAYWVGVDQARWSMVSIVGLSLSNILFNYALIFGNLGAPQMGVAGAGLGSTLATCVGLLINAVFAWKLARANGFLEGLPDRAPALAMVRVSLPESVRQVLFSLGVVLMYVLVGQIGTQALAAFHVVISICLVAYMPHIGLAGAATTLVGEAIGREDLGDAKLWGWQVSWIGLITLLTIALATAAAGSQLLALFISDGQTAAIAGLPLLLALLAHVLDGYGKVLAAALIGAGATRLAMTRSLLPQWLVLLPLLALCSSLVAAMWVFVLATALTAMWLAWSWQREHWQGVRL